MADLPSSPHLPTRAQMFLWPTLVFAALFAVLTYGGIDRAAATWLFRLQGGAWSLRDNSLLEIGFHQIGKYLSIAAWLGYIGTYVRNARLKLDAGSPQQRALLLIIVSVALTTLIASTGKAVTHMDCPWDLQGLGGTKIYVPLLEADHLNATYGRCFPAGQASAGYAWIALYFAALIVRPQWRRKGLLIGAVFGMTLGFVQQLRGAHFLSHDLTTAWIAWMVGAVLFVLLRPQESSSLRSLNEKTA